VYVVAVLVLVAAVTLGTAEWEAFVSSCLIKTFIHFLLELLKKRGEVEVCRICGIILKLMLRSNYVLGVRTGCIWLIIRTGAGLL
jgi:hypothetical protein